MSSFTGAVNATYYQTYTTGVNAYAYMFVFVSMYQQMAYDVTYRAPFNTIWYSDSQASPGNEIFFGANVDVTYNSLWLDLTNTDVLLTTPDMKNEDLWWTTQFLSMDIEVVTNIPGDDKTKRSKTYRIVGPSSNLKNSDMPDGVKLVRMPTNNGWVVMRIEIKNDNVARSIALSREFIAEVTNETAEVLSVSTITNSIYTTLDFYTLGLEILNYNGYPEEYESYINQFRYIGLNPDVPFNSSALTAPESAALLDAAYTSYINLIPFASKYAKGIAFTNFWIGGRSLGNYGDEFTRRALAQYSGYAANVASEQFYLSATTTGTGAIIDCSLNNYTMHFSPTQIPQTKEYGFFSITLYNASYNLQENDLDKYSVGTNRDDLYFNPDHSLDLYFQTVHHPLLTNYVPCTGVTRAIFRYHLPLESQVTTPNIPPISVAA